MTDVEYFQPKRPSGRSDAKIIIELVDQLAEGETLTFKAALDALEEELDHDLDRTAIYRSVGVANKILLRERGRVLVSQRGQGYRLSHPEEHVAISQSRQRRATKQIKAGVETLRYTDTSELSEEARSLHRGQLMIMSGLYSMAVENERRQSVMEEGLDEIRSRMDRVERDLGFYHHLRRDPEVEAGG